MLTCFQEKKADPQRLREVRLVVLVDCQFRAEVGFASLGVGIAGVIAFRASLPFRFATLIPPSAFSFGAAGGHIYQMIAAHNFSPGNVGLVLPIDILMPVIGFVFLRLSYKDPQTGTGNCNLIYLLI